MNLFSSFLTNLKAKVFTMTGSVSADPLITGIAHRDTVAPITILPTLSTLLVYILSAFATIKGDVFSAAKYLAKTRLFYFCIILLVILAAPSVGRIDGSVLFYRDIFINQTNANVQVIDQGSCCSAQNGLVTFSYGIGSEVTHAENGSQLFLPHIGIEEERITCANCIVTPIVNVLQLVTEYFIMLLCNIGFISTIVLKAPWFHFCVLVELIFRLVSTSSISEHTASRFQLLVRLRMAIGMRRVQRLSKVGLLRLVKSHVPLHSLEDICGFQRSSSLSVQAKMACLEDLTYLYSASDHISNYVEKLLSQHQSANKFRAETRDLSSPRTVIPKCELVYNL